MHPREAIDQISVLPVHSCLKKIKSFASAMMEGSGAGCASTKSCFVFAHQEMKKANKAKNLWFMVLSATRQHSVHMLCANMVGNLPMLRREEFLVSHYTLNLPIAIYYSFPSASFNFQCKFILGHLH